MRELLTAKNIFALVTLSLGHASRRDGAVRAYRWALGRDQRGRRKFSLLLLSRMPPSRLRCFSFYACYPSKIHNTHGSAWLMNNLGS